MHDREAIQKVLTMPRELRIHIVEQLLESLDDEHEFDVSQEVIAECLRIREAIHGGTMRTHTWEEVKARFEAIRRA
ncbi:MAG: addiction module protein [Planctomycetota bacterium]